MRAILTAIIQEFSSLEDQIFPQGKFPPVGNNWVISLGSGMSAGCDEVDMTLTMTLSLQLDVASLTSVRDFVKEFMRRKIKLNVLINNAAMMLRSRDVTPRHSADGLEITMATNHLGMINYLPLSAAAAAF